MNNEDNNQENSIQSEDNALEAPSMNNEDDHEEKQEIQNVNPEDQKLNQWVREIPEDEDIQSEAIADSLDNIPVSKGDLPDWINELSPADPGVNESEQESRKGQDLDEPIHTKSHIDPWAAEEGIDLGDEKEEPTSDALDNLDEGFVEISGYDLGSDIESEEESQMFEENSDQQEDLPDWLEDMISENPEISPPEFEEVEEKEIIMNDEPTRPVPIIEENIYVDDQEQVDIEDNEKPNLVLDEINITETENQVEEIIHVVDFDDESAATAQKQDEIALQDQEQSIDERSEQQESPAAIEEEPIVEELELAEENWEQNDRQPLEIPKALRFAKYLLDQKEIDPAYEIFKTHIKKSDHLDEIRIWIDEAIREENVSNSKLWELLGDIASGKENYSEAISSYTKSISILLNKK